MSNAFASAVFLVRNTDKVNHGDISRAPVVVAQTGGLINKVSQIDSSIGQTTNTAVEALDKSAKIPFGASALNTAGKLVNPLIIASSGVKVLTSDDKEKTIFEEAGALGGMFAAEGFMKNKEVQKVVHTAADDVIRLGMEKIGKFIKPVGEAAKNSNNKFVKIATAIISGAAFVGASIFGYNTGKEIGQKALNTKHKLFDNNNPVTKATTASVEQTKNDQQLSIES